MGFNNMFKAMGRRSKERLKDISTLDTAIDLLNIAKDTVEILPVKGVLGSAISLLTLMREKNINEKDFIQLAKDCSHLCNSLQNGVQGRDMESLTAPVRDAINDLNDTIRDIEREVVEHTTRGWFSRLFHAKYDKEKVQGWKLDFQKILGVFDAALALDGTFRLSDVHRDIRDIMAREGPKSPQIRPRRNAATSPRNFVGRDELIERLVDLINTGTPVALIGAGGIGKTSIALTLLEDGSIKDKFGNNRRFVRCDEVRSYRRFLRQLSKVIGAGIENPPDLTALRPFLSSVNILLIVDNAEIILDPHTPEAPALYSAVEELSRIKTISLLITTRISTIPATCEQLEVSPLSMISAREAFYNIFTNRQRTPGVDSLLRQLDFHPLSITLLATVATQNRWDHSRLIREWKQHRISLLQTHHTLGLSTAIELSLSSPTFTSLGPDARDILCVIAVFPQGINQHESGWIFPTVSNVHGIIDMFCVLSLTHRNHEFVTMLAPIQEYLQLDGSSHSLFSRVRNRYLTRIRNIAHGVGHGHVPPQEMWWFVSEEANIDFLLVLSMRTNPDSMDIQRICGVVTQIALFHPPRATFNGQHAIQPISDRLRYPLLSITWVKNLVGYLESTYSHLISLEDGRTRWASRIVCILLSAAVCNTSLGHSTKAISQTEEALGICVGLQDTFLHALCYRTLARLSERAGSLNEATGALLKAKELHLREGDQVGVFECHINLSNIYQSRADLDGAKENLIAAAKIMYRLKKRADLAATFRSLALVCEEQNDHINARRYRRWTCILVRKVLPDLRIAEEALENSSLALIRGDLETAKADAKVALKTFKKIGCTGGQEETISVLDVISSELSLQESSDPTTRAPSDTA